MQLKYVIIDHCFPIVFAGPFKHKDARAFSHNITSAGFVEFRDGKAVVGVEASYTLNIGPDAEDENLLDIFFGKESDGDGQGSGI